MLRSLFSSVVLLYCSSAHSGTYGYYPDSPFALGRGIDPTDLSTPYPPCLTGDEISLDKKKDENSDPGMQTDFSISEVTSREQLYRYLSVSASVSGHYALFQGGAKLNLEEENTFDQDSFTWIVRVYTRYGKFGMKDITLSESIKNISKDIYAIRQRCGYEYVAQVERGVLAAAVYTVKNLSRSSKSRLEATFTASASAVNWGGEVNAGMKQFVSEAARYGTINLKVFTIGGAGAPKLARLMRVSDNIKRTRRVLENYTRDQNAAHSAPMSYSTAPLAQFVPGLGQIDYGYYLSVIDQLFLLQADYSARARRILNYVLNSSDFLTDSQIEAGEAVNRAITDQYKSYLDSIAAINERAQKCRIYMMRLSTMAIKATSNKDSNSETLIKSRQLPVRVSVRPSNQLFADLPTRSSSNDSTANDCEVPLPNFSLLGASLPAAVPFSVEYEYEPYSNPAQRYFIYRVKGPSLKYVTLSDKNGKVLHIGWPIASGDQKIILGTQNIDELDASNQLPLTMTVKVRSDREYRVDVPSP